ncbi:uncharacterized protein LOC113332491 [Papaver somniferum]|uniref:uncharacterized protein LOC113332491 n=1 Tax=Papaver somniferum TaxID=3469 RepID=UPI000E6FBA36|nr:uncharacterized protein LOC113332491 [Papaver somniferum]
MNGGGGRGNYRNPCLTMHQPWASLLVYGIKRIEGRSWPAPIRGRLWIHAAGKVPDQETIKAMEDFYREIYKVNGVGELKFPEHYPTSRLLGCIDVVGCLRRNEVECWQEVPEGVRLEAQTDFCWLCENPQRLLIPFEMRGFQGVYNLERRIYDAAVRGLTPVKSPLPVKFPLPHSRDSFSLKPGSLVSSLSSLKVSEVKKPETLMAAIAGARAAATQYSKQPQRSPTTNTIPQRDDPDSREASQFKNKSNYSEMNERHVAEHDRPVQNGNLAHNVRNSREFSDGTSCSSQIQDHSRDWNHRPQDRTVEESRNPATIVSDRSRLPQNERYRDHGGRRNW